MTNMKTTRTSVKRSNLDVLDFFCPSVPVLGADKNERIADKKPLPGALAGVADFSAFVVGDVDFAVVGVFAVLLVCPRSRTGEVCAIRIAPARSPPSHVLRMIDAAPVCHVHLSIPARWLHSYSGAQMSGQELQPAC